MASMIDHGTRSGENRESGWVNPLFTREGCGMVLRTQMFQTVAEIN